MPSLRPDAPPSASLAAALCLLALSAVPPRVSAQPASALAPASAARDLRDEVIYEMFVRNATPEGTLRAATARLASVRDLGATTVWLMPVYPIGEARRKGSLGSPYSIRDYTAVSPELGSLGDLRAFTAEAHRLGMRVVLDWVANHTAWDHPWIDAHPDWYTRDASGAIVPPVADWADVADLNYEVPAVRRAMTDAMRFWVEQVGVDGFRCDVAEMVPEDFWRAAIAELRSVRPDLLMLAEGQEPGLYAAGFDLTYDWPVYTAMKEVWRDGKPVSAIADALRADDARYGDRVRMRFTTNHDETAWDRPPPVLFSGTRGAEAAYWTVGLLPGVPLVYNGQEGGSTIQTGLFDRDPLPRPDPAIREVYDTTLDLRARYDVLRRGTLALLDSGSPDVLLFERILGAERVLVAVNTRSVASNIRVPEALRARYNGTLDRRGRLVTPAVATREVRDLAALRLDVDDDDDAPRIGTLAVPEILGLASFEVRTFGTLVLRTR